MNEIKKLPKIIHQCMTIGEIPTSYKISLTYEEQLMWFCRFLEQEVIPVVNNNSEVVQELKTYVENYFENLDVQEEINNKLDEMVESGELEEILEEYFDQIRDFNYINVKTMGAKGDGITDDTEIITEAVALNKPLYFPEGTYIISDTITIENDVNWLGQGNKTIINSRPTSELHSNIVSPVVDFSGADNIILKGFCTTNSTFKIYPTPTESQDIKQLMRNKYVYIENVTNDVENNTLEGITNWQGAFINIPAPDNYNRDWHTGKYPRYAYQIFNNSGYNAIDIDNRLYDDNGDIAIAPDNSAIGITDSVLGSAPAFFIDMHGERNAINIKNRTNTPSANSTSNQGSVFQVGYNGHVAIGCSVYDETGASGTASLKIKDSSPIIKFYDTNYTSNVCAIRETDNKFEFLVNGNVRSYYDVNGQHVYVAPLKVKPNAISHGGLVLESTYANGLDFHLFVNDKGQLKIQGTQVDAGLTTEAGNNVLTNLSGNTSSRPTSKMDNTWQTIGTMYFDTTLGKPIWWNGTAWVDATGTSV